MPGPPRTQDLRLDAAAIVVDAQAHAFSAILDFGFELREAPMGCLTTSRQSVSAHCSHRTRRDVDRSSQRKFLLLVAEKPWEIEHNSHNERMSNGDCVLVDSHLEHRINCPEGYQGAILRLPVGWLETWIPEAAPLVGRRIPSGSQWGRIVSPMAMQFTPRLAAAPPLPHAVLVDQLGATLALAAGAERSERELELFGKLRDCILERCTEPQLTAADVAASLGVSSRTVHRALAAGRTTFASELVSGPIATAQQILASSWGSQLSTTEVAERTGFLSTQHFLRALHKRSGRMAGAPSRPGEPTRSQ